MIKLTIDLDENTPVVALAGVMEAARSAGLAYRLERSAPQKEAGTFAAYRQSLLETQRLAGELRREAERRARDEQGLPLPRARFGDWWEQPR